MKGTIAIAWLCAVCTCALGGGLSEYASPDIEHDAGRIFRPAQDLKASETRTVKHNAAHNQWKQSQRTSGQIVYGKPVFLEQAVRQRTSNKKFRPSPEYDTRSDYAQKYANQLYAAQKNAGQLSDYQRYIINQDPEVKKFVFSPRVPKKIHVEHSTAESVVVSSTARPTTTEKAKKEKEDVKIDSKLKSWKKQAEDSTAQATSYKFVLKPEYVPVYAKDAILYDQAVPFTAVTQFTPTYASGGHINLDDHLSYKIPATYEKEEYPTKEPKYEFKYEVKDHEKNSNFGHTETRKGKTTWGKYYVQLSDGRLETVKYWADKTGYHAEVDFKGQAKHPQSKPKEQVVFAHGLAAQDLKLYGHEEAPHQFYAVSEHSPIGYH